MADLLNIDNFSPSDSKRGAENRVYYFCWSIICEM